MPRVGLVKWCHSVSRATAPRAEHHTEREFSPTALQVAGELWQAHEDISEASGKLVWTFSLVALVTVVWFGSDHPVETYGGLD